MMMSAKVELAVQAATRATEQPDRPCFTGSNSKLAGALVLGARFVTTSSPQTSHTHIPYAAPANPTFRRRRRQILPEPPAITAMSSSLALPRHHVIEHQVYGSSTPQRNWNSTSALLRPKGCLRPSRYSCSSIASSADSELPRRNVSAGLVPTLIGRRRLNLSQRSSGCYNLASTATASPRSMLHFPEQKCSESPNTSRQDVPKDPELGSRHRSTSSDPPRPRREEITKSVSFYSQVDVVEFQPPLEQTSSEGWSGYFSHQVTCY